MDRRTGSGHGLPLAWETRTAKEAEMHAVPSPLDTLAARGFSPETAAMDKGYDYGPIHEGWAERDVLPIVARRRFAHEGATHEAPTCEHGTWTFAGADFKRKAAKWRCPFGECKPASVWIKADRRNPLVPRGSKRFGDLYRGRAAVEREFGRLKNEYGLTPLRVRGLRRSRGHAPRPLHVGAAGAGAQSGADGAARGVGQSVKQEAGPATKSVRLKAPRLARIARWWVAGSGRNLSAGPVQNILRRFGRESG